MSRKFKCHRCNGSGEIIITDTGIIDRDDTSGVASVSTVTYPFCAGTRMIASQYQDVQHWNANMKLRQDVIYVNDLGKGSLTCTRSRAWVLGDGTGVVKIEGQPGCVVLDRCTPVDLQNHLERMRTLRVVRNDRSFC